MTTLTMSGYGVQHRPTRAIREAARGSKDPLVPLVSTGQVRSWDLLTLRRSEIPGLAEWADKTLDAIVAAAASGATKSLACVDCEDLGFYGITDTGDTDTLVGLLRRIGEGGYEQLVAGAWRPYEPRADVHVEVLSRDLATDLAEALTAGASGLTRRYFWPLAFLPPGPMLAAAPADEVIKESKAQGEDWTEYAIVDDLDPGAVLELIRLRPGPELVSYQGGIWGEAPELLAQLQGVQPPPLVELDEAQLASVLEQIGGAEGGQPEGEAEGETPEAEAEAPASETPDAAPDPNRGLEPEKPLPERDPDAAMAAAGPSTKDREKAAEKGQALPEGGFPIKNRADLKKAVQALGRATNKAAAKRHIIKRARELNAVGALPEDWGVTAAAPSALLADAPLTVSPDPRAEKLRRYWSTGKGAAKIRWGTPGDWTRCYRQLRKHMGVRAKGYCQNLHKRNNGVWAGDRSNRGRAAAGAVAASGNRPAVLSMEAALVAVVSTGRWIGPGGGDGMLKDGVYAEAEENAGLLKSLTAGGFPVQPPDDWFGAPDLEGPTPLTVDDDGRVYGHIATFDIAHIGLPGKVHAPKSKSDYAYFKTGTLVTASGKRVNVGQLTLAGGHAPLQADAAAAVAHYDNTASAVADVNAGEDRYGIWVAGALRPEVSPSQLRTLRASAPSGDWRPINGHLELVACCQVNVPGFPTARARVASGAITALVAAGARPLAARRLALLADAEIAERITALETFVYGLQDGPDLVEGDPVVADADAGTGEGSVTDGTPVADQAEDAPKDGEKPVSDAVKRARALAAERRQAKHSAPPAEGEPEPAQPGQTDPPTEEPVQDPAPAPEGQPDPEAEPEGAPGVAPVEGETPDDGDNESRKRAERLAALRERVHGNREPVAASGAGRGN